MPNSWIIKNKSTSPRVGDDLNNLQIQELSPGRGYQLVIGNRVLSSTTDTHFPIHFTDVTVPISSHTWDIEAKELPPGAEGKGKWTSKDDADTSDNGEFQAQAGTGLGEKPGEAASSANA